VLAFRGERDDWQLFLDPQTLPQKAGCQPDELSALVLKELVDNALDTGANVALIKDRRLLLPLALKPLALSVPFPDGCHTWRE
jgi:hypothetical protein